MGHRAVQWDKNADKKLTREECTNPDVLDRFYRIDLDQDQKLDQGEWIKYARRFRTGRYFGHGAAQATCRATHRDWYGSRIRTFLYVPSPLVYRGVVYLIKDGGILSGVAVTTVAR